MIDSDNETIKVCWLEAKKTADNLATENDGEMQQAKCLW
jgi:hypothetical protein